MEPATHTKRLADDAFSVEETVARDQQQHRQRHSWHDFEVSDAWRIEYVTRDDPGAVCVLYAHMKTGRPLIVACNASQRCYELYFQLPGDQLAYNPVGEDYVSRLTERMQELDQSYCEMGPPEHDPLQVERLLLSLAGYEIQLDEMTQERRVVKGARRLTHGRNSA